MIYVKVVLKIRMKMIIAKLWLSSSIFQISTHYFYGLKNEKFGEKSSKLQYRDESPTRCQQKDLSVCHKQQRDGVSKQIHATNISQY